MTDDVAQIDMPQFTPGDIKAIIKKHHQLHALLEYICIGDFEPFCSMPGSGQQSILLLALSASTDMDELLTRN
ncbi:MAG TPA: hypothetical protein VNS29_04090 [Burkholderiaceae bacterium]|nr:hypothetical protein [Burkholderiaceae bacterium]